MSIESPQSSQSVQETYELLKKLCPELDEKILWTGAEVYMILPHPDMPGKYIRVPRSEEEKALIPKPDFSDVRFLIQKALTEKQRGPEPGARKMYGENKWWARPGSKRG